MYGRVSVDTGASQRLLTLPQTAVTYNAYGAAVFVIRPAQAGSAAAGALTATQQFVETGATRGDQVAITRGLQEGDLVATSGQLKLKNGDQVVVNNAVTPLNDENPHPPNE
jgi:membrane fusion protein (multidrug efflux system)